MDAMPSPHFTVVLNKQSGPYDGDQIQQLIEATLPPDRLESLLILEPGGDLCELVRTGLKQARRLGGCLVLAGGDGTVNAALPVLLEENDVPFSVLPLGTFNFFARSQGIDPDPETALRALVTAEPVDIPVASLNGQPFVINISIGFFPRIIDARERHQARFGRNRLVALLSGFYTALGSRRDNRLVMNVDGQEQKLKSPMVSVVFNRYQVELLKLDSDCIDQHQMTVLVTRPVTRWGMFCLLMRGATGSLDGAENFKHFCASEVTIRLRRRRVRVAIDGETQRFPTPLRLRVHPRGLRLMAPAAAPEADDAALGTGVPQPESLR